MTEFASPDELRDKAASIELKAVDFLDKHGQIAKEWTRHTVDIDRRPTVPIRTHWIIPIPRWWLSVKAWFRKVSSFPEDQP